MNGDKFAQQIKAMHRHVATLQQRFNKLAWEHNQQAEVFFSQENLSQSRKRLG